MNNLAFYTALILNRLRNEIALRDEQEPADQQERGADTGYAHHEHEEAESREVSIRLGRKSPTMAEASAGSCRSAMTDTLGRK